MKQRSQLINQIKADLPFYGIDGEAFMKKYWSKGNLAELKQLSIGNEPYRQVFNLVIEEFEYIRNQVKSVDKILLQLISTDKYSPSMKLLLAIPGIGRLTAITLLVNLEALKDSPVQRN